jgi:hypothetical protein
MSYTNVEIPDFFSSCRMLHRKVSALEHELKATAQERDLLQREMDNILVAIKEHGYIDIRREGDRDSIRLIEKPKESEE